MLGLQDRPEFKKSLECFVKFRIQRFRSLNVFESLCQRNPVNFAHNVVD